MKNLFLLVIGLLAVSCATTMPGHEVSTGNKSVSATMEINHMFTDDRIQMHQFSIKNNTNEWMEFEGATITSNESVKILVGDHITSWIEACTLEKNVSDYNTSLLLGSLAIGGAVVAGSSHQGTSTTGAVIALGSISAMAVKGYQDSKKRVEFQEAFPEKHIFRPVVIPPGKVIQRWILLENETHSPFMLKLKNTKGHDLQISVAGDERIKSQDALKPSLNNNL